RARPDAVSAASAIVAVPVATAVLAALSTSAIVTVTVFEPSSAYTWLPATLNEPPLPVIVPAVVGVPSPQSIVAADSLADALASGSTNVATCRLKVLPGVALTAWRVGVIGGSTGVAPGIQLAAGSGTKPTTRLSRNTAESRKRSPWSNSDR